jgi:hypothetical protein
LLSELVAPQIGDDGAVAKDINVVALLQFVGLGRVPQEGPASLRLLTDEVIDL